MLPWPWLSLGRRGEAAAAWHLWRRGFKILKRSYRCPLGEIDVVALDGDHIVFVEVRTRVSTDRGEPWETIRHDKQRKLTALAAYYLKSHPKYSKRPARFDVVSVVWPGPWYSRPTIRYFPDAFAAQGPWNS